MPVPVITPIDTLKQWFQTSDTPTQEQFYAWLDSFRHLSQLITINDLDSTLRTVLQNAGSGADGYKIGYYKTNADRPTTGDVKTLYIVTSTNKVYAWINGAYELVGGGDSTPGEPGLSAYEVAVAAGFVGTEAEWLESLTGTPGTELRAGTATTLPTGSQPTITLRQGVGNVKLVDIGVPKGDTGDTGTQNITYQNVPYQPVLPIYYNADTRYKMIEALEGDITILTLGMKDGDPAGQYVVTRGASGAETITLNGQLKGTFSLGADSSMMIYYECIGEDLIYTIY